MQGKMLGLFLLLIVSPINSLLAQSNDECTSFQKSALNNILLIGLINNEQLLLITVNSKLYLISYNEDPKSGDVNVNLKSNSPTILDNYYPQLVNDVRFKRALAQNSIQHTFIFFWRTRLRMVFIGDDTIEYYPEWSEVHNNRFRLPSIETIPLSSYDKEGKILYMLNVKSTELKIQAIYLDSFPCDIFDMENILSNPQYRYICYSGDKNFMYIETSVEKRCSSPVKLLVRIGFISKINVYLITERYVYFFSRQALINTGKNYHFYKILTTSFFQCQEKEQSTIEEVNDDEPVYEDHWKPQMNNKHKKTEDNKSSEFNLNYLWIILVVVAFLFLIVIFYLHLSIRKRKRSPKRNYGQRASSSIVSNISSSRVLSQQSMGSRQSSSIMSRFLTSRGGGSRRSPSTSRASTLRNGWGWRTTQRAATISPTSSQQPSTFRTRRMSIRN
nr:uncharacterized protein LOC124499334 [Dermatophagoides farinae]